MTGRHVKAKILSIFSVAALLMLGILPALVAHPASASGNDVIFHENDSSSDAVIATEPQGETSTTLTSFEDLNPTFVNNGYSFVDWNSQADGEGTSYADGGTYTFSGTQNLYAIWTAPDVTIGFLENDNSNDLTEDFQTANAPTPLTSFADLSPQFSNPGHTFVDWNTEQDGSGTSYADGAVFDFSTPTVLYAIWSGPSETVTYEENDNDADGIDDTQTEDFPTALTSFADLSPQFSNPGYTFVDWNTEQDGSGTSYANGAIYSFSSGQVLWAQWTPATSPETLTFSGNGASGSVASISGATGDDLTLPSGSGLSLAGYAFVGWNTQANGTGTEYGPGQTFDVSTSETLYAQWAATTPTSTAPSALIDITMNVNGASTSVPTISGAAGTVITLPSSTSVEDLGFTLTSWNTEANGSGSSYTPGQALTLTTSMTLYAQWTADGSTVTVNLEPNGGSGTLTALTGISGSSVKLPSSPTIVRANYTLKSWNTEADGKGVKYSLGATITPSSSLTLYAQWVPVKNPTRLYGAIGDFPKNSSKLTAALERQVRTLATALKEKKYVAVKLYGYTAATGVTVVNKSLSKARAVSVANYLRVELRTLKVSGVTISAAGEGSVAGKASSIYSLVEVFVS